MSDPLFLVGVVAGGCVGTILGNRICRWLDERRAEKERREIRELLRGAYEPVGFYVVEGGKKDDRS